ncbi:MAG TPA: DUF4292 domain-containing protein [Bacteroidales bacterium]|nr:DUF4292 domain-containing protein [Bacteroidales bacterium]
MKNKAVLFFVSCLLFVGCSSSKKILREPIKEQGADFLLEKLQESEVDFSTMKARFTLVMGSEKQQFTLQGQLRMRFDSLIWVSLTKAGLEVYRAKLTPDTLYMINRMGKEYLADPIGSVYALLNNALDFDMIQAFLIGNDFKFYDKGVFKAGYDSRYYRLNTANRRKLKKYIRVGETPPTIPIQCICLNPENFKIEEVIIQEATGSANRKLFAFYDDFRLAGDDLFPYEVKFAIEADQKYNLSLSYSRVSFDEAVTFPYSVSSKYSRITYF